MACLDPLAAQVSPGPLSRSHDALEGALNCLKCHGTGKSSQDNACLECHREIAWLREHDRGLHARTETDCARCHPEHAGVDFDLVSWEEGDADRFDHERAGWPLEGKHAGLACRRCHRPEFRGGPVLDLRTPAAPADTWLGLDPDCRTCHEDVHGGALDPRCDTCHGLSHWKPVPWFDHAKTEYPLTGKHAPVECAKCHLAPRLNPATDDQGRPVPLYKPLPHRECSDCHQDPHAGRLGPKCAGCHDTAGFERIDRAAFDHSRTRYPLLGRHVRVDCARCHDPVGAWGKKPRFDACSSCHADPHAGKATLVGKRVDCADCHGEEGFRPATYTVAQHETSTYPLAGKHRQVRCGDCHRKNPSGFSPNALGTSGVLLRPPHETCCGCHDEAHGGQLARRPDGGACESCHGVDGWKPSRFSVEQHADLRLPLQGRHARVDCGACHGPVRKWLPPLPGPETIGRARVALTNLPVDCAACHVDPHRGRFAAGGNRPQQTGCNTCHDSEAFRPSEVDVPLHRSFRYPLDGAHRAVPCAGCHRELGSPPAEIRLLEVRGAPRDLLFETQHERCETCHRTPHGEQFAGRAGGDACDACHDLEAFRPAPRFDHTRHEAFALDGAHRDVACGNCHPSREAEEDRTQVVYRPIPHRCQDCHRGQVPATSGPAGRPSSR